MHCWAYKYFLVLYMSYMLFFTWTFNMDFWTFFLAWFCLWEIQLHFILLFAMLETTWFSFSIFFNHNWSQKSKKSKKKVGDFSWKSNFCFFKWLSSRKKEALLLLFTLLGAPWNAWPSSSSIFKRPQASCSFPDD